MLTPCCASHAAAPSPRAPSPPVIRKVPSGRRDTGDGERSARSCLRAALAACGGTRRGPRSSDRPSAAVAARGCAPERPRSPGTKPRLLRLASCQDVQSDDVVCHIGTCLGHPLGRPDVPLADLHEAAARAQGGKCGSTKPCAGEAVEHHVHAGSAGVGQDLAGEVGAAGVVDALDTQRPQIGLLGLAGRGENSAPLLWASWTAARPTPPLAAWISTRSPACTSASWKASLAVVKATGTVAASTWLSRSGLRASKVARTFTRAGKLPGGKPHDLVADPELRDPVPQPRPPGPTARPPGDPHRSPKRRARPDASTSWKLSPRADLNLHLTGGGRQHDRT